MDLLRGRREGLQIDADDIVVAHRPGQAHQEPPDGKPAPVGQQRGLHRLPELDVKLLHLERAHGVGDEAYVRDGAPGDQPEAVDEKPVLVRAKTHPVLGERKEVVGRAAGKNGQDRQKLEAPGQPRRKGGGGDPGQHVKARGVGAVIGKDEAFLQISGQFRAPGRK